MELSCPRCGAKSGREAARARAGACAACGADSGGRAGARPASAYDGYAVGRRLLRLAPAWLLLLVVAFALSLLVLSWAGRRDVGGGPGDEAFRNEASNQPPVPDARGREGGAAAKSQRAADAEAPAATEATRPPATPEPASGPSEAEAYSVQVGAFVDLSQANEQVSRLRASGYDARVVEAGAETRFRFQVRSGRYVTREEAARLAGLLRSGGVAAQTVVVGPEGE
ncbi:MAG TPA: SPOR domain-containing protein [Pyrinomonadaceae bacterium]|jgi:cell division septation protein DedD